MELQGLNPNTDIAVKIGEDQEEPSLFYQLTSKLSTDFVFVASQDKVLRTRGTISKRFVCTTANPGALPLPFGKQKGLRNLLGGSAPAETWNMAYESGRWLHKCRPGTGTEV
ncbi:hypothetical protein N7499_003090 [Penicillium canescens]|nr:hypothetical protein N7522_000518 [Penicillium canescens]KAJ6059880.1 hypothetical protein N7444_003519 [Penicillium canescens]KAJ6093759.1 hypothetical protein N7499_003090 [Penicillium canescens]KAJ6174447.1 hypothetical protein N7485_005513 [Penicillium canescens]